MFVKALQGARPWLRVGDYRVLYALAPGDVYEIERIVHRRDLDSAAAGLVHAHGPLDDVITEFDREQGPAGGPWNQRHQLGKAGSPQDRCQLLRWLPS